jgi:hypothetical protein
VSDTFNYLAVLFSVVIGLAVTEILQGLRRQIAWRRRVTTYWPALLWSLVLLVVLAQTWWAMFGLRNHRDWTFAMYGAVLLHTVLLYLAAGLVLPEDPATKDGDLRAHYLANATPFFGLVVAVGLASLLKDIAVDGALPDWTNVAFHLAFMAGAATTAIRREEWLQRTGAVFAATLFAAYVAILFSRAN